MACDSTCSRFVRISYRSNNWYALTLRAKQNLEKGYEVESGEWLIRITNSRPAESWMSFFLLVGKKFIHLEMTDQKDGGSVPWLDANYCVQFFILSFFNEKCQLHECETLTANIECLYVPTWLPTTKSFVLPVGYPISYCVSKCFDHFSKIKKEFVILNERINVDGDKQRKKKFFIIQYFNNKYQQHQIERIFSCLGMICLLIRQTKEWLTTMLSLSAEWVPKRKWMKNCLLQFWYAKRESFSFIIYRYMLCPRFFCFQWFEYALFFSYSLFDSLMIPRR